MKQTIQIMQPQKSYGRFWHNFWWICLSGMLMNGLVLSILADPAAPRTWHFALFAVGAAVLALGWAGFLAPEGRRRIYRLAPLLFLFAALLLGNPVAGFADWFNGRIAQWNIDHEDGVRMLQFASGGQDCLSFQIIVVTLLGLWSVLVAKWRNRKICFATVMLALLLALLGGQRRALVCASLVSCLLGFFLTGQLHQASHRGCVIWLFSTAALLLMALIPGQELTGFRQFHRQLDHQIQVLRYGENSLPQGNLYRADKLNADTGVAFTVSSQQEKGLYLRSFLGSLYRDGQWEELPKSAYKGDNTGMLHWLSSQGFSPQTQLAQYFSLGGGGEEENRLDISVGNASRYALFTPSSLEGISGNAGKMHNDGIVRSAGILGKRNYSLSERSGSRPGELLVTADWVLSPETEAQAQYAQAEAVYRSFVYQQYTQVDSLLAPTIQSLFHGEPLENDSIFTVLNHIRQVLRSNLTLDKSAAPAPEDQEPLLWFLTQSRRGNAVLFASATVEALRSYGIPARYAEGYYVSADALHASGTASVTGAEAHAWVEAYLDGMGWIALDATPGYYYDMVSLQRLVSLPEDVTKTSASIRSDDQADSIPGGNTAKAPESTQVFRPVSARRALLFLVAAILVLLFMVAVFECVRRILLRILRRRYKKAEPLEQADILCTLMLRALGAWGIHTSLGWKTEQIDAQVTEHFPGIREGEFLRVSALLEKALYGGIPLEIYEERTVAALLQKLMKPPVGVSLPTRVHFRYRMVNML